MGVKIWNPGTDDYDDYAGTPEYIQVGDLPTVTPKWIPTEAVDETLGRFDVDVLATDAEVVHDTGNETGLAGNKQWTGDHVWEYGADGKLQITQDAAQDTPIFGLYRSGETLARVGIGAPMSFFGLGAIFFTNGTIAGASIADNGTTALTVQGRDAVQAVSFASIGKTGATATPLITAGGTTSGAPTSGAHLKGEVICDDVGRLWRCTVAGTPGTWVNCSVESVAREARPKTVNQFYYPFNVVKGTGTMSNLSRLIYLPVFLPAGTIDRIGIECTTTVATAIARLGIYADSSGLPGARIAEATTTADLATGTGYQTLTISAVLPTAGRYWLAHVPQTALGTVRTITAGDPICWAQQGTTLPAAGTSNYITVHESAVAGALPANAGTIAYGHAGSLPQFHIRYSA